MTESSTQPYHHTPFRIGLFLDTLTLPKWALQAITNIVESSIADIVLLVVNDTPPKTPSRDYLLYDKFIAYDYRKFKQNPDAFENADLKILLPDCPIIHALPQSSGSIDTITQADVDSVQIYNLDVAIRFGFQTLQGKILETARYGFWSYRSTVSQLISGDATGFWEMLNPETAIGNALEVHSADNPNGHVIYESYAGISNNYSVVRTNNQPFWHASSFMIHKLNDLYEHGPTILQNSVGDSQHKQHQAPNNLRMLTLFPKIAWRYIEKRFRSTMTAEQWNIGYYFSDEQQPLAETFTQFKFLKPPKDRFWADPFVVKKDDKFYIFIEDFVNETNLGHLAVIEMDDQGNYKDPYPIMKKPYHLSYPFIFEWENEYYMIPETNENKTIDLYRCASFPDQWEYVQTMIQGVTAADATIIEIDDKWWMFVTIGKDSMNEDLYIYYSDSPMGEWKPHKQNPVKSDVRSARPAGKIFKRGDTYYRPAQDCSVHYGYALVIHRIVQLDTETYIEEQASKILPQGFRGIMGTHTINHTRGLTVIDGNFVIVKYP